MIETNRLKIYAASQEEMETFIASQSVDALKEAYSEMLDGCLSHSEQWEWYAIWIRYERSCRSGQICICCPDVVAKCIRG